MATLACLLAFGSAGFAGTIIGTIRGQGPPGASQAGPAGKYESRKYKFADRILYTDLKDFVVFIDEPSDQGSISTNKIPIVTQKDATFRPHVLPVRVGTTVEWPNEDDIFHNVFSISESNPFDLGLYKHPSIKEKRFATPGRVDVFCAIHRDMHCIVLVLETPYFAVADQKNRYAITNVPAGKYRLKGWQERLPSRTNEVIVPENGEVRVDFILGFSDPARESP